MNLFTMRDYLFDFVIISSVVIGGAGLRENLLYSDSFYNVIDYQLIYLSVYKDGKLIGFVMQVVNLFTLRTYSPYDYSLWGIIRMDRK